MIKDKFYVAVVAMHTANPDWSEEEIAEILGLSVRTISRWLTEHYAALLAEKEADRLEALPIHWQTVETRELGSYDPYEALKEAA